MNLKKFRRLMTLYGGIAAAIISVIFLFYIDITLKAGVEWLLGIAGFGLIGSVFMVGSAAVADEEENFIKTLLIFVATVLAVLFIVLLFKLSANETFVKYAKYGKNKVVYLIIYYLQLVVAFGTGAISLFTLVYNVIENANFLNRAFKYYAICKEKNELPQDEEFAKINYFKRVVRLYANARDNNLITE